MSVNTKIYFVIFLFIIVLTILGVMIYFISATIIGNGENLSSIKEKIALINRQNKEIDDFKKKYDQYKENLDKVSEAFVNTKDPVNFIEFIEKLASEEGVSDLSTSIVANAANDKTASGITFRVSFLSDFFRIVQFAEKIEKGNYLARINQLEIKEFQGKLSVNILIQAP